MPVWPGHAWWDCDGMRRSHCEKTRALVCTGFVVTASRSSADIRSARLHAYRIRRSAYCTSNSAGRCALSRGIDGVNRLACNHEQPVALGAAEGDVAAYLRQPNPAEKLGLGAPHRDPTVAYSPAGIACAPEITEHVGTEAIRTTMHAIDMAVGEHFRIRQLVVRSDIQDMDIALAGRPGTRDVQLLEIGREAQAIGVRHLVVGDHCIEPAAGVQPIDLGGQLLPRIADTDGLTDFVVELAFRVALAACGIRRAFVKLRAVRRVGEPDAAVRVRDYVIGRVEPFSLERVGEHGDRAVKLVTHEAPRQMLAGKLPCRAIEQ